MKTKHWRNRPRIMGLFVSDFQRCSSISLRDCGLDPELNFLQSPECGCGGEVSVLLDNADDVINFCSDLVLENGCEYCAVFALDGNNKLLGVARCEDELIPIGLKKPLEHLQDIGRMFDAMELHCYGLIIWNGDGKYRIVEE